MTVLWIYDMPLVPEAGGTERITALVAKGLSERWHRCMGILQFNEHSGSMTYGSERVTDLYSFLKENKVDVVINQIAYARWLLADFLASGGNRWRSEGGRIISCLHFDPRNPSLRQLLASSPVRSIRDRVNLVKATLMAPLYSRRQRREEGNVYNFIYGNSDAFVTLSETHFPYLKKVMGRGAYDRLTAINNPLTFDGISPVSELDHKKKVALVCSRMSEYHKRISLILRAWRIVKRSSEARDWSLKIVGDGPDLERYKAFVAENRLPDVEFFGQQSPEPYYREASILMLASSAEGWGLTLTEALQRGAVPVVMDSSPVFREIVGHCYNGYLVPNGDVKSMARHVVSLIADPRRLRAMQGNALLSAGRFSKSATMDKWDKLVTMI